MPFGGPLPADVLFCSFHTPDDYYAQSAQNLRRSLDRLGIAHEIAEVPKAPGEEWLEICRKKIPFLHSVCESNPKRKIFWIDVDCDIDYLPDFVSGFSADIIGFQRGFGHPMRIGYANSARFWEPCFWGINTTAAARNYIRDARAACETMTMRATDDFFFEEAWRKNADQLTFQMIPSSMLLGRADLPDSGRRPFFYFGSSGNVATFKGLAAQHSRSTAAARALSGGAKPKSVALQAARRLQGALPRRVAVPLRRLSDSIGLTEYLSPTMPASRELSQRSIYNLVHEARSGNREAVEARIADISSRRLLGNTDRVVIGAAMAFLDHVTNGTGAPLPLLWWDKPYPGNYGDWLSPLILQAHAGRPVRFQRHDEIGAGPHLMAVGSIGRFAQKSSILVGTGFSRADTEIAPDATYISLRGPHSAQLVAEAGGPRVERFGDPAAILPRLIPLERPQATNGRLALVRHFAHRKLSLRLPEQVDELSVLLSRRADIESLIGTLLQYDAVLTSAMHVYITCHAYGIPVGLITFEGFEDAVAGDRIKYRDYAAGVGLPERLPQTVGLDLRHRALTDLVEHDRISEAAMDDIESALTEAVAAYDRAARPLMQ
ncbi:polysaccharide pyruvyl transferase family protein [Paracoccus sp. PS-1]|uniref:polysaccharide pyruvyl transferase family protein n=1 Tax=unclassified Paracoccus (in: a-proteobacteria) TaxID=2688777 RepID=UPI00048CB5D1|nr:MULTISPECIES: polysaccharide pyruvyl transferase family protein [unclassified Paracoccus (in: a-proteobacteria)]MDQ7263532.1 polysaccharide pyruvyl transferase family protein [Paracoccus sp. PS1]